MGTMFNLKTDLLLIINLKIAIQNVFCNGSTKTVTKLVHSSPLKMSKYTMKHTLLQKITSGHK
jgi:hypothetical protein